MKKRMRETRDTAARVELRVADDGSAVLSGYAAVFPDGTEKSSYRYGSVIETIAPGAFARALRDKQDVRALFNHDSGNLLVARNRALLVFAGFVSFGDYGLMANNCEHFVSWCKTGKAYSTQVTNFFIDATSILASIIIRNPAPLMVRLAQRKLLLG